MSVCPSVRVTAEIAEITIKARTLGLGMQILEVLAQPKWHAHKRP